MKLTFSLANFSTAVGLSICAAGLAVAQISYAQDGNYPAAPHSESRPGQHHQWRHKHQNVEQRLTELKAKLQIEPNQEGAWQSYASAALKAQENRTAAAQQHKQSSQPLTLPQRIDQREAMFQQMHADQQTIDNALKQLYGSLTKPQQAVLDKHFTPRHHRGAPQG